MDGQELAAMYADFERWMPGFWTHRRPPAFESDYAAVPMLECAVLDELERRGFCVQVSAWGVIVGNGFTGDGPTRLHRLHAACLAAFGTEARP